MKGKGREEISCWEKWLHCRCTWHEFWNSGGVYRENKGQRKEKSRNRASEYWSVTHAMAFKDISTRVTLPHGGHVERRCLSLVIVRQLQEKGSAVNFPSAGRIIETYKCLGGLIVKQRKGNRLRKTFLYTRDPQQDARAPKIFLGE